VADTEDHEEDTVVIFTPSYHLEWLLGDEVVVVFEPEDE